MKKTILLLLVCTGLVHATWGQTGKSTALETIGALSAITVYNYYIVIGAVSDGYDGKVYKADFAKQILQEQMNSIDNINTQMKALSDSGFLTDASDKTYVADIIDCLKTLKNEATYCQKYIDDESKTNLDNYKKYRTDAWNKISKLLGLGE